MRWKPTVALAAGVLLAGCVAIGPSSSDPMIDAQQARLAWAQSQWGPRHPFAALELADLAALYEIREPARAARLYRHALSMLESALASDHPLAPPGEIARIRQRLTAVEARLDGRGDS